MSDLPSDIITNIISRLPVKSLLRFKCVSKPWLCLIEDSKFIKMHLDRAIVSSNLNVMLRNCYLYSIYHSFYNEAKEIDYPYKTPKFGVEILGSCNGLLCVSPDEDVHCIWNPSTTEFKKLPETPIEFPPGVLPCVRTICFGFGYDQTIDDYKVVRIVSFYGEKDDDDFNSEVKVYTLGTNSWKRVEDVHYHILYKRVSGVLVNGALHWAATVKPESDLTKVIVSFDLADEKFKEVPQPNYEDYEFHMNVGKLGGCLCVLNNFYQVQMQVWVMNAYGVKDSWTKLLSISQPFMIESFEYLKPLCYSKDGEVLLEKDNKDLVLYDFKSEKVKTLRVRGIDEWFDSETYVESLVALNTGTYVGQEQAKGSRKQNKKKSGKKRLEDKFLAF